MLTEKDLWAIEKKLREDQEELDDAQDITEAVFPTLDKLEKRDIINEVRLFLKLLGLENEFRLVVYYLFRIALEKGPDGSFIVLDAQKAKALANEKQKAQLISMSEHRIKTLCVIINFINARELTKPSYDLVFNRGGKIVASPLISGKSRTR